MTILQMRCFLRVCECRKYSEAAERLGIPQSALFKQLKAVEDEFSVRLFQKARAGLDLTEAGALMYPHVTYMYGEYRKMLGRLQKFSVAENAQLVLGSMYFLKQYNIIQMVQEFRGIHPGINVGIWEHCSYELDELLRQGKLDGCFAYKELIGQDMGADGGGVIKKIIPIREDHLYVMVNKKHPLADKESVCLWELRDEKFVLMQGDKRIHKKLQDFCLEEGFVPREYQMDVRNETIKELITYNNWASLFMGRMADDLLDDNLTKIRIEGEKKMTMCFAIANESEASRIFADFVANP